MRRRLHIKSIYFTLLTAKFSEYSDLKNACSKNFSLTCHYGISTDEARIVIQSKNILTLIIILIITIFKIYNDIWTGSLPHCLQLFPSRLAAWSSTNCLQRYIKNPELPSNSGVFCDNIVFSGRDSFSFTLLALRRERLYERE